MHKKGHYGAALTAYAPVGMGALTLGFDVAAVGGGLVAVGLAMLPDVDMNLPNVAHRGPTHTIHFAFGVGIVTGVLGGVIGQAATSHWLLAVGSGFYLALVGSLTIGSHIAADALTPMGVTPFGDDRHYSYDLWNADSIIGNYGLLALGILAVSGAVIVGAELNNLFAAYF
jgi:inner membrane protein